MRFERADFVYLLWTLTKLKLRSKYCAVVTRSTETALIAPRCQQRPRRLFISAQGTQATISDSGWVLIPVNLIMFT